MSERFFSQNRIVDPAFELTGDEAHHLEKVMRIPVGAEVVAFDGSGAEFRSQVVAFRKGAVRLEVVERVEADRESAVRLHVGVALPKGDRQKVLVEKLVELGVAKLTPIVAARGVALPVDSALVRLERGVVEASKQCRRNVLMQIEPPARWADFVRVASGEGSSPTLRLIAHPYSTRPDSLRRWPKPAAGEEVVAAIGPEGGFTDEEVAHAIQSGWKSVSLGPRILRVETAAAALAARLLLDSVGGVESDGSPRPAATAP